MAPQVSIVIPTYNRPALLTRAIQSVLKQTFKDFEILILQNGAAEHSKSVAETFLRGGAPVRYFYLSQGGAVEARNRGVQEALGKYIAFLDDDDEWLPEKLEKQIAYFEAHPQIGLLTSYGYRVDDTGRTLSEVHAQTKVINFDTLMQCGCQIITLTSVMVKRECLLALEPFNPKYLIANDYDLYIRFSKKFLIGILPEPLFRYSWHVNRTSSNIGKMFEETCEIAENFKAQFNTAPKEIKNLVRYSTARYYYGVAVETRDRCEYENSAKAFSQAIFYDLFVGLRSVHWGKYENRLYRFLRPYAGMVVCAVRSFFAGKPKLKLKEELNHDSA